MLPCKYESLSLNLQNALHVHIQQDTVACICNSREGRQRQENLWKLAGQLTWHTQQRTRQPTLNTLQGEWWYFRLPLTTHMLQQVHLHTDIHKYIHVCTHRYMHM